MKMNQVTEYIEKNWDFCIRSNKVDCGTVIGVPYPYTVPAIGHFDSIYYWDTYFTNVGLFCSDRAEQAKFNTNNILYLIDRYGFMPNGNHSMLLDRSQPPFFSMMVYDVYEYFKDKKWLKKAYETLEKEYAFWMSQRNTELGLNRYGHSGFARPVEHYAKVYCDRVGYKPDISQNEIAVQFLATAESGWDLSPRFGDEITHYIPIELNSLLYQFEMNMDYFSQELGMTDKEWKIRAGSRKEKMNQYLLSEDNIFCDYNFEKNIRSEVFSAASFFPLFCGLADEKQANAILKNIDRLEAEYGVLSCEKINSAGVYQWGYPNGWACLQYIAVHGLIRCGYREDAKRIAEKYTTLVESVFEKTGKLWEKYNVVEGNIQVVNEYDMPPMMGWTAGVYLNAKQLLEKVADI